MVEELLAAGDEAVRVDAFADLPAAPFDVRLRALVREPAAQAVAVDGDEGRQHRRLGGGDELHVHEARGVRAHVAHEEVGLELADDDLHCFGYVSEKSYEGAGHWLMFLFDCRISTDTLPCAIDEGHFEFFSREAIDQLKIPETDHTLIWPYFDKYHKSFVGLRANCDPQGKLSVVEELQLPQG